MKLKRVLGTTLAATILGVSALAAMSPAQAVTYFDHENFRGQSASQSYAPNVGNMNDRITSIRTYGQAKWYYEDAGFLGRHFWTRDDHNNLGSRRDQLHGWETWNDRISSFR